MICDQSTRFLIGDDWDLFRGHLKKKKFQKFGYLRLNASTFGFFGFLGKTFSVCRSKIVKILVI